MGSEAKMTEQRQPSRDDDPIDPVETDDGSDEREIANDEGRDSAEAPEPDEPVDEEA